MPLKKGIYTTQKCKDNGENVGPRPLHNVFDIENPEDRSCRHEHDTYNDDEHDYGYVASRMSLSKQFIHLFYPLCLFEIYLHVETTVHGDAPSLVRKYFSFTHLSLYYI